MSSALVIAAGLLWLGLLFGTALWAERRPSLLARQWPIVYSLSLAVYCTSWTFYGTVTQAQRSGWPVPPTFIGTILLYLLGFGFLVKLLRLAREHNSTSLADLIATRLGKNSWLAAMVTLVAVIGIVPYIALQLKAVAMSYDLLTRASNVPTAAWQDSALYVALAMAIFAMLFGTRRVSAAEHNRGLVLAMAVESLLKLAAMLAVGAFVAFGLNLPDVPVLSAPEDGASGFPALIVLGALAMFTLPHQFHMGVVECREERQLRTARWLFPAYLLLIALPILPLARAGDALLAPLQVPSDLYVLALPLAQGQEGLALLAFLGGLSAATGMVILATLALSVMISNHWIAPLLLRGVWAKAAGQGDLRGAVLLQRRLGIVGVVLCAWLYSRAIAGSDALADIGALSFSGLATLAPAVWLAVWRPRTPPLAVLGGLLAALAVWSYVLLLPALADAFAMRAEWIAHGPFGWAWLSPDGLLGLGEWSRIGRATTLSLLTAFVVSALLAMRLGVVPDRVATRLSPAILREVAARFLPSDKIDALLAGQSSAVAVSALAESQIERELAAVLGAASARLLLNAAVREQGRDLDAVATLVGEASQVLRFNQRVLEAALENMTQGISVVDADLRLVAWNSRYAELFAYPPTLLKVGVPVAELVAYNIAKGLGGGGAAQAEIDKRIRTMRAGTPYVTERRFGETVVEIRGNPMPGGGFVATFTDVTQFRGAEAELKSVAATLEQRVAERTAELAGAKGEAERANRAKTRFLAAVSHDLAQPLNAAHLFVHALAPQLSAARDREALDHIDSALSSAELLLSGLLDISRLEAGGLAPNPQPFRLDTLLQPLVAEFGLLAAEKGLQLRSVATNVWVRSDAQLLRRVLQNFISNAVRHTVSGRILVGVRRRGAAVEVEVWDTGPGIALTDHALIFEEFRRLHPGGQGLGLGLAIAERIARLLQHPIRLRSQLERGSVFAIEVPRCEPLPAVAASKPESALPAQPHLCVLVVDNDADVLRGMQALLQSWECTVVAARDTEDALRAVQACPPDLWLLDYHLDAGQTGLQLLVRLNAAMAARPCIIISADHSAEVATAVAAAGCLLLHKPLKPLALKSAMARLTLRPSVGPVSV